MPGRSATFPPAVSSGSESMAATLSHASQVISTSGAQRSTSIDSSIGRRQQGYAIAAGRGPTALGAGYRPASLRPCTLSAMEAASGTLRIGDQASSVVGGTPLVVLRRLGAGLPGDVCAKLEYLNPGGSVKDRMGAAMIAAAGAAGCVKRA